MQSSFKTLRHTSAASSSLSHSGSFSWCSFTSSFSSYISLFYVLVLFSCVLLSSPFFFCSCLYLLFTHSFSSLVSLLFSSPSALCCIFFVFFFLIFIVFVYIAFPYCPKIFIFFLIFARLSDLFFLFCYTHSLSSSSFFSFAFIICPSILPLFDLVFYLHLTFLLLFWGLLGAFILSDLIKIFLHFCHLLLLCFG